MEEEKKLKFIADGARSTLSRVYLTTTIAARHHNFIVSPFIRAEAKRQKAFFLPHLPSLPGYGLLRLLCAPRTLRRRQEKVFRTERRKRTKTRSAVLCAFSINFLILLPAPRPPPPPPRRPLCETFCSSENKAAKTISFHSMPWHFQKLKCCAISLRHPPSIQPSASLSGSMRRRGGRTRPRLGADKFSLASFCRFSFSGKNTMSKLRGGRARRGPEEWDESTPEQSCLDST